MNCAPRTVQALTEASKSCQPLGMRRERQRQEETGRGEARREEEGDREQGSR